LTGIDDICCNLLGKPNRKQSARTGLPFTKLPCFVFL
jgi:hypothetical protein